MSLKFVRCPMLLILAAAALVPSASFAAAAPKEPTTPENVVVVRNSRDVMQKLAAIRRLANVNEADELNNRVTELLVSVIQRLDSPLICKAAVDALVVIQKNATKRSKVIYIPPFIPILREPRSLPLVRYAIADNFSQTLDKEGLPDRQAFTLLQEIARNRAEQNIGLRGKCIEGVGSFGDSEAIGMLADLVADPDPLIKEAASRALAILLEKNPDAGKEMKLATVNRLVEMMKDLKDKPKSKDLHVIVIKVVAQLIAAKAPGANAGLEEIVKLVSLSKEDKVVSAGIEGLGIIGTAEAVDPLIKTYGDFSGADAALEVNALHRKEVVTALGQVLSVQASKPTSELPIVHKIVLLLVKAVGTDVNAEVRGAAVFGLSFLSTTTHKFSTEYGDAAWSLVDLLKDTDKNYEPLKPLIADSLASFLPVIFGKDADRWTEWLLKNYPPKAPKP